MCDRRQEMLDAADRQVILVADAHELERVSEAAAPVALCDNGAQHPNVYRTVIVLKPGLFRSLRGAIEAMEPHNLPIQFFSDSNAALTYAEKLCQSLS
ncbi:hypothetical protein [Aggregatilinea lenta]|uniref:hypothetical protein n=1 Tax=Aggregatilinea lenta TaxID=913108 RepID=UPI000E5A8004|nr:hypothetical protein [Aggregatilinea lenta]